MHDGCHHDVHGGAHGHHVQVDIGAPEDAVFRGGVDEAALHHHLGAQGGEALDMLVDGADAEVAAAGHGHLRLTETAQEGANQIIGCPHLPGQLIGGPGRADVAGVDLHRVAVDDADAGAQMLQDLQGQRHIGDLGDVLDAADPVHQKGGGENGHGGVFGAADLYFTKQGMTTLYNILRQSRYPLFKRRFLSWRHIRHTTVCPARGASYPQKTCEKGKFFRPEKLTHIHYTTPVRKMQTLPANIWKKRPCAKDTLPSAQAAVTAPV